jgi:phosphoribosylaminoimidazole-succinocarboxamide synthase
VDRINELAVKVNAVIKPFLSRRGLDLIDCTIQVGRIDDRFLLSSPITVENCSLRDIQSGTTFSQENLKLDSRSLRELYQTVVEKVGG